MAKNLVIVESPAKAKTIQKFLGNEYKVMSSFGHIRDLHKKAPELPQKQASYNLLALNRLSLWYVFSFFRPSV